MRDRDNLITSLDATTLRRLQQQMVDQTYAQRTEFILGLARIYDTPAMEQVRAASEKVKPKASDGYPEASGRVGLMQGKLRIPSKRKAPE